MKAFTFFLVFLSCLTITLACNEGEKKCCSAWFGCQCEGNKWVNKLGCQKKSRCVMKNGDYTCGRRASFIRAEEENVIGLPNGPVALPAPAVNAGVTLDPMCAEGQMFCVITNYVDKIYFCEFNRGGFTLIKECGADEHCVGRPLPPEMDPHCAKQTTTTYRTNSPFPTSSAPFPYLPEKPTSSELVPRMEATTPMCSDFMVFCASSNKGDFMSYCGPSAAPKVLHQCAIGEYCVGIADESKHVADIHCAKEAPAVSPSPTPPPPRYRRRIEALTDAGARVYCDDKYIMYAKPGAEPEIVHTCVGDQYCTGNDNPWEGRIRLFCQYEDPAVSTPGHSHSISIPAPTRTLHSIGPYPRTARDANELVPSEVAAVIENSFIRTVNTRKNDPYTCGFCNNLQGRRRELLGIGVCNTLANDEEYRACSNQYCGLCIIFR
ncbi:Nn.00g003160.m01.CDS01 [Neocucurbitaria sp. VM-36]